MKTYIVDSYAWIAYFNGERQFKELIEGNVLETPSPAVAEVVRVLLKRGASVEKAYELAAFIRQQSLVLELGFDQSVLAGRLSFNEKLPLADAIIYSYSNKEKPVLTGDAHFCGKPNVKFIKEC